MTSDNWQEVYEEFLNEEQPLAPSYFEMEKFLKWLNENYSIPEKS